jgi:hypothetical protein
VALLLLNDFVLKAAFHDGITGKLSDVAGIVVVAVLGCALWPGRRWTVAAAASLGFAFWKSAGSQFLIDFANELLPVRIGRTVDASDLLVLPLAWLVSYCVPRMRASRREPWRATLVTGLAAFALVSTTRALGPHVEGIAHFPSGARYVALLALFDRVAEQYGLEITRQHPEIRVYADEAEPGRMSLEVYLHGAPQDVHYLILYESKQPPAAARALRQSIATELRQEFPGVELREERAHR